MPLPHARQLVAPVAGWDEPAAQLVQLAAASAGWYAPEPQAAQTAAPAAAKVPSGHSLQPVESTAPAAAVPWVPALHGVHNAAPPPLAYVPTAQIAHDVDADAAAYAPSAHSVQLVAPPTV